MTDEVFLPMTAHKSFWGGSEEKQTLVLSEFFHCQGFFFYVVFSLRPCEFCCMYWGYIIDPGCHKQNIFLSLSLFLFHSLSLSYSYNDMLLGFIMFCIFFPFVFFFIIIYLFASWVSTAYCCSINAKEKPLCPHFNTAQAALLLWPQMAFGPPRLEEWTPPNERSMMCYREKGSCCYSPHMTEVEKVSALRKPSNVCVGCGSIGFAQRYCHSSDEQY